MGLVTRRCEETFSISNFLYIYFQHLKVILMEKTFFFRMIITMVITMGFAQVTLAEEPRACSIDGTAYFVWNIDGNGTLHIVPIEATTSNFDKSPFYKYREQIKSVIIEEDFYCEEGFATIGNNFFKGLDRLESVQFQSKVRNIGESVFEGCTALKEIVIPTSVESIGRNALRGCSSLVSVSLPFLGYDGAIWVNQTAKNDLSWIFGTSKGKAFYTVSHTIGDKAMSFSLPVTLKNFSVNSGVLCNDAFDDCASLENINLGVRTRSVPNALVAGHYSNISIYTDK